MSALLLVKMAGDDDNSTAEMAGGIGLAGAGAGFYGYKNLKSGSRASKLADAAKAKAHKNIHDIATGRAEYKKAKKSYKSSKGIFSFFRNQKKAKDNLRAETSRNTGMHRSLDKALESGNLYGIDPSVAEGKAKQYLRLSEKAKNLKVKGRIAAGLGIGAGLAGYEEYQKANRDN